MTHVGGVPHNLPENQKKTPQRAGTRASLADRIRDILDHAKKRPRTDKAKNGPFFGVVLDSRTITVEQFKKMFGSNKAFAGEVLAGKTAGSISEVVVHIPEITGVLPLPKEDWVDLKKEAQKILSSATPAKDTKKLKDLIKKVETTMHIISMYPRFYGDAKGGTAAAAPMQLCKVSFTDKYESKAAGFFGEVVTKL